MSDRDPARPFQRVIHAKALEAIGLTKRFGGEVAVDNLSFSVNQGTIHGLLGPNGSGKTTTVKMGVGLLRPDEGSMMVFGEPVDASRGQKSRIGYMPELPSYPGHLTAIELLQTYGRLFGLGKEERSNRIREAIETVGLTEDAGSEIRTYTKGMKQRMGLAQVLMGDPEILVLDEPSAGLDPLGMLTFREHMETLSRKGKTILLSSHLLGEVEKLCTDVTILSHGRAVASGGVEDLTREVGGSPLLEIELAEIDDQITRALQSLPIIEDMKLEGKTMRLSLSTSEDARPDISRALASCGGVILSMREVGATLEDVFVRSVTQTRMVAPVSPSPQYSKTRAATPDVSTIRTVVRTFGRMVAKEDMGYELDIVNVGPKTVWFTEAKDLVPAQVKVKDAPTQFDFKRRSIRLDGLALGPLESKTIKLVIQPCKAGILDLSPQVDYLDEFGEARVHFTDSRSIFVSTPELFDLGTEESRKIFDYLVSEFIDDSLNKRLSLESSGWRSLVQISEGAVVSASSLYGREGKFGPPLSKLLSKGIVELRTFQRQRGRGGEATKVRVRHELDAVTNYLDETLKEKKQKSQKTPI